MFANSKLDTLPCKTRFLGRLREISDGFDAVNESGDEVGFDEFDFVVVEVEGSDESSEQREDEDKVDVVSSFFKLNFDVTVYSKVAFFCVAKISSN